jgi:hypothetical protein
MVGFLGGFLWRLPKLAVPLLAAIIAVAMWRLLLPERLKTQRGILLVTAVEALLVSVAVLSLVSPAIFADTE